MTDLNREGLEAAQTLAKHGATTEDLIRAYLPFPTPATDTPALVEALTTIAGGSFEGAGNLAIYGDWHDFAQKLQEIARAALSTIPAKSAEPAPAAVREGFVIVPVEPTEAMLEEADRARALPEAYIREVYAAMLAASRPTSEGEV